MLNEVKMRGLGVALAAVNRSENAADERDEVRQERRWGIIPKIEVEAAGCLTGAFWTKAPHICILGKD